MSNGKQQTAVELLEEEVYRCLESYSGSNLTFNIGKAFEKIKPIEKKQIKRAFDDGEYLTTFRSTLSGDDYYNETYGGGEQ